MTGVEQNKQNLYPGGGSTRSVTSSRRNPDTIATNPPAISANQAAPSSATKSTTPVRLIIPPETTRLDRMGSASASMGL